MTETTFREALAAERPLQLPIAHDALSARLIERAGFRAYSIGGFALVGCRYGLPDVGVVSFGEMAAGVRDIIQASRLPVLVDGDDGYGDVKNVTRTVRTYESMGAGGIFIEDQVAPKRCGHMAGKSVIAVDAAVRKLEAALAARRNADMIIMARTDARAVHGLDDALARAERFIAAGVDAVFVEAPTAVEEIEIIGRELGGRTLLIANMAEGGRTPLLPLAELGRMGYAMVGYPSSLLLRVIKAIRDGLAVVRGGDPRPGDDLVSFQELTDIVGIAAWNDIDDRYGGRG
ncbi:MAG: oxaloacetate decarboxylase [Gammaproteobacteria bacterium]|nr:oxaloacetate decarboxylase [Gammaproteobacteria bacterium]